jgi:hypothetical protein
MSRPALGPQLASYSKGMGTSLLSVKQLRHEADYSLPSSAEVKNKWRCNTVMANKGTTFMLCIEFVKLQQHSLLF